MARLLRTQLFLLAALTLTQAVNPAAGASPDKPRLLGGLAEADVNEEGVQQALNFALSEYNKASNDAYHSRAMRVVRARKQVSPGLWCWGPRGREGNRDGEACVSGGCGPRDVISPAPLTQPAGGSPRWCFSARQFLSSFMWPIDPPATDLHGLIHQEWHWVGHFGSVVFKHQPSKKDRAWGQGRYTARLAPYQAHGIV